MDKDTSPQQSITIDIVETMGEKWNNCAQTNGNLELLDILQNNRRIVYFKKFSKRTDSIENIEFWKDVEKFKKIKDPNKRVNKAKRISKMYLSNSKDGITISSSNCKFISLLI
jgi:hypothetical protein